MKSLAENFQNDHCLLWQIHEKISSWTAHLLGPLVFNFGIKEEAWNLKTADLLLFPEGSVGRTLGEFLKKNRLEPIARAESHDLYHILFDFPTSFKGEVALQFFLRGMVKTPSHHSGQLLEPGSFFRDNGLTCDRLTNEEGNAWIFQDST